MNQDMQVLKLHALLNANTCQVFISLGHVLLCETFTHKFHGSAVSSQTPGIKHLTLCWSV